MTIWLDHAATSWPKPPGVVAAMTRWFEELGVDASRGTTPRHETVRKEVAACRRLLGELTGTTSEHVVFCSGATEAINVFLKNALEPGDTVWTTALEHNALARPIAALEKLLGLTVVKFTQSTPEAGVESNEILEALARESPPKVLAYNHVSNVTGAITDLSDAAGTLRDAGCVILADCAQSAGRLHLETLDVDALAIPAHKGLQGPPGLGALCLRRAFALEPLRYGGTGSSQATVEMPTELPIALEAGTPNTPAILGLRAGIEWVLARGIDTIHAHERAMAQRLRNGLAELQSRGRLALFGGQDTGVLAMTFADLDAHEASIALAQDDIVTRAGYHCTADIHALLGADHGTLRTSPGPTTTTEEIDFTVACISELAG